MDSFSADVTAEMKQALTAVYTRLVDNFLSSPKSTK
jgi:hypothetical protein